MTASFQYLVVFTLLLQSACSIWTTNSKVWNESWKWGTIANAGHGYAHGVVGTENFTYISRGIGGNLLVVLESLTGDVDLYISESGKPKPTYNSYDLKSTTCGIEEIDVSHLVPPFTIGIYGGPSEETSEYALFLFVPPAPSRREMAYEDLIQDCDSLVEDADGPRRASTSEYLPRNERKSKYDDSDDTNQEQETSTLWDWIVLIAGQILKIAVEILI